MAITLYEATDPPAWVRPTPADVQADEDKLFHVLEGPAQCAVAGACSKLEQAGMAFCRRSISPMAGTDATRVPKVFVLTCDCTVPVDLPAPTLPKKTTSRSDASRSVTVGSLSLLGKPARLPERSAPSPASHPTSSGGIRSSTHRW